MAREIPDVSFHGGMPKAFKMKKIHLAQSLLGSPMFESYAIRGKKNASAVVAEPAVDIECFWRSLAEEREELSQLFVGRGRPAARANAYQPHSGRFRERSFGLHCALPLAAQIYDSGDSQFLEFFNPVCVWLRAAKDKII